MIILETHVTVKVAVANKSTLTFELHSPASIWKVELGQQLHDFSEWLLLRGDDGKKTSVLQQLLWVF